MHCRFFGASKRLDADDTLSPAQFDGVSKVFDVIVRGVISRLYYYLFFFVKEAHMREHLLVLAPRSMNLNRGNFTKVYATWQRTAREFIVSILG